MQKRFNIIMVASTVLLSLAGISKTYTAPENTNPTILKFNDGTVIKLSDIKKIQQEEPQLKSAPFEMIFTALRSKALVEKLVDKAASKDKALQNHPDVKKVQEMCRIQGTRDVYMKKEVEKRLKGSEIKSEYNKYAAEYKKQEALDLKHILVSSKEEAAKLIGRIKKGEKFDALAKKYSQDPNSKKGKSLGFLTKSELPPSFAEVAYALKKDSIANTPVQSEFGWHVIFLKDKKPATPPKYSEMQEEIKTAIMQAKAQEILQELIKKEKVKIFEIDGTPVLMQTQKK